MITDCALTRRKLVNSYAFVSESVIRRAVQRIVPKLGASFSKLPGDRIDEESVPFDFWGLKSKVTSVWRHLYESSYHHAVPSWFDRMRRRLP